MKKILCFVLSCFALVIGYTQVPNQVNYQGIARNNVGNVLPNKTITVRLSVRDGSSSGTVVYTETRSVTTNAFGLFYYGIGSAGATSVTGTLGAVNWATGNKYLQVEMDPNGGTNFTDAGTTQLLSVPYALYAAGASPTGVAGGSLTGNYPNPAIANGAITLSMIAPGVLPTTLPPSGPAGGSLTGSYPNPTIANAAVTQGMIAPGVTLPPSGAAGGSLTGNYPNPLIANGAVTQTMIAPGVTLPPSGAAGGSLTGSYPNPLIANGAVTQVMIAPGVTLPPGGAAGGSLSGNYPNPSIATGAVTQAMIAPGVTLPPSGAAGGDLSGTYPNPTVSKILGRSINNIVPVVNNVLGFDGTNWGPVSLPAASTNFWAANGDDIYNNNAGKVGIGTNVPQFKLHVEGDNGLYGIFVRGASTAIYGEGQVNGVYGYSTNGKGVIGTSVNDIGVRGGSPTIGVEGGGGQIGVRGESASGMGVYGKGTYGVRALATYAGVYSESDQYGVVGYGDNTGVYGSGDLYGAQGHSSDGSGIYGQANQGIGVNGFSYSGRGGNFYSQSGYGLWAKTDRADRNWAGVFEGNVYTYNSYQTSDENLKKNIEEVSNAMNVLLQIKPKSYEFRDDGKLSNLGLPTGKHYGVLAQDLEAVLPNLVKEVENEVSPHAVKAATPLTPPNKDQKEISKSVPPTRPETIKIKAVNYTELIPIIIKGMQEQQAIIKDQKEKIRMLEERFTRLESLLVTSSKK